MKLLIFRNGILCKRDGKAYSSVDGKVGSNRGKVLGFSLASRRRLREWLLRKCIYKCSLYGVTLTIPECECKYDVCDRFRRCWHRFRMSLVRRFPSSGFVWRVELQVNRMPHLHIISYHDSPVSSSDYLGLWFSAIKDDFTVPSLSSFARHGVRVDLLDGSINAYRYICDHGSKSKQAQLGWLGRQWGIVGKSRFSDRLSTPLEIPESLVPRFNRFLSRVCSFRVRAGCVFGNKIVHSRRKFRVCYVSDNAVRRWLNYYGVNINCFDVKWGQGGREPPLRF